ncbi:MAG: hypothetical protein JST26_15795 [Bacteroidetes bacterium]|nr:hypothetical protein [Bacteroidota bacterium]
MKHIPKTGIIVILMTGPYAAYSQCEAACNAKESSLTGLLIPAVLGVLGYIGKTLYEIYSNKEKRKRELIENRLRYFYWPISIRLKENENTYHYLFKGKKSKDPSSTNSVIAHHVEKNVLMKNHEEILSIITEYRYLAETDPELETIIRAFIRHVVIYKAFLDASINEYPGVASDAPYPTGIDTYFYKKTEQLQKALEKMKF